MPGNKEFIPRGLKHGGRIKSAAEKYAIAEKDWLDLSTGLNPNGWKVANIPASVWQTLPEDDDGLQKVACSYYGCDYCLPVSGSQAAIQILPSLRSLSKVGVLSPAYAEHEHNWQQAGHHVVQLTMADVDNRINELDVLVVINPNNPTGELIAADKLLKWHQKLSTKGGWLIIDEAFMDVTPEYSLLSRGIKPGLIVLRSLGKFFGLAGIRCGFVITDKELLQRIADKTGPWSLSGPTRYIAKQVLQDKSWHKIYKEKLQNASQYLSDILTQHSLTPNNGTALFQWLRHPQANDIFEALAQQGILIRLFEGKMPSLRFGLPANKQQWLRLERALTNLSSLIKTTEVKNEKDKTHV